MSFLKKFFAPKAVKTGLVFIVEDSPVYANTLKIFLQSAFPQAREIKVFPVGETSLMELHRNPDLIIMDHFLDSKYPDAETGLEIIRKIREEKTDMNIIVLSSQKEIDVVIEAVKKLNCSYIKKDNDAFARIEEIAREIL